MRIRLPLRPALLLALCAAVVASTSLSLSADPAPDFSFSQVTGEPHTLAEFRGKVVLLEFWASWCIPCRKGFPFLDQLQAKHEAEGLKVVAVSLETDTSAVLTFVSGFNVRFLVGRDPSGRAGELFQVTAMPTALLLDKDGRPLARFEGGTDATHQQMESAVEAVLRGDPLPASISTKSQQGPKGNLKAWERGYLADPIMSLDGDPLARIQKDHIFTSKEGAAGNGGVAGGGCGCN
jgi:thiol-disulfide isomerase/thioredoxin